MSAVVDEIRASILKRWSASGANRRRSHRLKSTSSTRGTIRFFHIDGEQAVQARTRPRASRPRWSGIGRSSAVDDFGNMRYPQLQRRSTGSCSPVPTSAWCYVVRTRHISVALRISRFRRADPRVPRSARGSGWGADGRWRGLLRPRLRVFCGAGTPSRGGLWSVATRTRTTSSSRCPSKSTAPTCRPWPQVLVGDTNVVDDPLRAVECSTVFGRYQKS